MSENPSPAEGRHCGGSRLSARWTTALATALFPTALSAQGTDGLLASPPHAGVVEPLKPPDVAPLNGFLDIDGHERPFTPASEQAFNAPRGAPRYWLAAAEDLVFLGFGTAFYWLRTDINQKDWDRPSLMDRLTLAAVRFDNNDSLTNHVVHPFSGAAYYATARVNNIDPLPASLYAFGGSLVWESALEWRELISINDMVFTSVGGLAMGEFFFQMGEYATTRRHPNWLGTVGEWTFGMPRAVHRAIFDDQPPHSELPPDALGLDSSRSHRFYVAPQFMTIADRMTHERMYGLVAEAELARLPGFGRPGRFATTFSQGNFTEASVETNTNENDGLDLDLWFLATFWGRYAQTYDLPAPGEEPAGHATMIGLSTALRYADHHFLDRRDQVAVCHLLGPNFSFFGQTGSLRTRLDANAHVDFAAIRSLAFEDWRRDHDPTGVKSVLVDQNYQFHMGGSTRVRASAQWGPALAGVRGAFGLYESLEGADRFEEKVSHDLHGSERLWEWGAWVGGSVPPAHLEIRLGLDAFGRDSHIADVRVRRWDLRTRLSVGAIF